jgi:hypothetical protein
LKPTQITGAWQLPCVDSLDDIVAPLEFSFDAAEEQLDWEPPELVDALAANGPVGGPERCASCEVLGPNASVPAPNLIFAVLVELAEQLPAEPLTPVELVVVVLVFDTVALLLQLYAFATFGVIAGAKIIANIL